MRFNAGDYEVGEEIPLEAANGALDAGVAIKIRTKGQRQTKVA